MSPTTWQIDPAHTNITFSAKHMMITTVRGSFGDVEGSLDISDASPATASGEIRVKASSLSTGFGARDAHLRSADFLDAERYPEIIVRFAGVEPIKDDRYRVTADVTIRDVTRPVAFRVEHVGETKNMQGNRHVGFTVEATINREDWGLNWNMALETGGWLVGKEIKLLVEVVADEVILVPAETDGELVAAAA